MEKLRGDNGKAMDMCVKELREASSNATEMEQAIESPPTNTIVTRANSQRNNNVNIPSTVKGPVRFTQEEDNYLRQGIEKFGFRWVAILKCPLYNFQQSRVARTLRKRAMSLKLI